MPWVNSPIVPPYVHVNFDQESNDRRPIVHGDE